MSPLPADRWEKTSKMQQNPLQKSQSPKSLISLSDAHLKQNATSSCCADATIGFSVEKWLSLDPLTSVDRSHSDTSKKKKNDQNEQSPISYRTLETEMSRKEPSYHKSNATSGFYVENWSRGYLVGNRTLFFWEGRRGWRVVKGTR